MTNMNCLARLAPPFGWALALIFTITPLIGANEPEFEVASVRRADTCSMRNHITPNKIAFYGDPLKVILMEAFGVKTDRIAGPSWLDSDCFDIVANMPEGATRDQLPAMLRALLVKRLKLVSHTESRMAPGFELVLDKDGPKFKESDPNDPVTRARAGQVGFGSSRKKGGIKGSMTMATLARLLSNRLEGPVQDLTGLDGTYDIDFWWVPGPTDKLDSFALASPAKTDVRDEIANPADGGSDIFTSIRDSLGLRLRAKKQSVDVVVIDSIERVPTEN